MDHGSACSGDLEGFLLAARARLAACLEVVALGSGLCGLSLRLLPLFWEVLVVVLAGAFPACSPGGGT